MKISKLSEEYASRPTCPTEAKLSFEDGARVALDILRGYLGVKSHISDSIKIEELKKYIEEIDC